MSVKDENENENLYHKMIIMLLYENIQYSFTLIIKRKVVIYNNTIIQIIDIFVV